MIEPDNWLFPRNGDVLHAKKRAVKYFNKHGTFKGAEQQIEEFVRQWALDELIEKYDYPKEWCGEKITIEEPIKISSTTVEADIVIKNSSRRPFLIIETKKYNCSDVEWSEGEGQLESQLSATHTATIGMLTDGNRIKVLKKNIDPNEFDYIPDISGFGKKIAMKNKLIRDLPEGSEEHLTGLKSIGPKYEQILIKMHNIIRDIDGLHDDEALDELSKLIYAKIFDERMTVASKDKNAEFRFQVFGTANPSEAASNIRDLYENARDYDVSMYSKRIPGYERSRGVFKHDIRLSDVALYRGVEELQMFSFVDSDTDIKGRAFQAVLAPSIRAGMGQYFTPAPIVDLAVKLIQPKVTDFILDPFCGSGHFLTKTLDYVLKNQADNLDSYMINQFKFFHLHGIELSDRMVRIAMTDMMLHDDGHTNIRNTNSLLSFDNYPDILQISDDDNTNPEVFDIILTNPPFGKIMREEAKEMVGRFALGKGKKSLALELLGLERSFQFLKPGGKLGIVLPEGIMSTKSVKFVREMVEQTAKIKAVIRLPESAFNQFGAMVKTCLCIFQKLKDGEQIPSDNECLLVEIENIGYDSTGKPISGSEIPDLISLFNEKVGWV